MFEDVTPPLDGLALHTRASLRSAVSMVPSKAPTRNSTNPDPVAHGSTSTVTRAIPTTIDELASLVLPSRFD